MQGMDALNSALSPIDVQASMSEIDLRPAKLAELGSTKPMPIGQQDRASIPVAITSSLACSFDQSLHFRFG